MDFAPPQKRSSGWVGTVAAALALVALGVHDVVVAHKVPWVAIVVFGGVLLLWLLVMLFSLANAARVRNVMLRLLCDDLRLEPANPADYPQADLATLERLTDELTALGFTERRDRRIANPPAHLPPGFCRQFAHPQQACVATLMQVFPANIPALPLYCVFAGFLEDGWVVSASTKTSDLGSYTLRHPRSICISRPEFQPGILFPLFLEFRDQVMHDLGIRPLTDLSEETIDRLTQERLVESNHRARRRSLFSLAADLRRFNPKAPPREWLGDYPQETARRKRQTGVQVR